MTFFIISNFVVSPISLHFLYLRDFVVSPVSGHFLYSKVSRNRKTTKSLEIMTFFKEFCRFPVSRYFPYARDVVVSSVSRHFRKSLGGCKIGRFSAGGLVY